MAAAALFVSTMPGAFAAGSAGIVTFQGGGFVEGVTQACVDAQTAKVGDDYRVVYQYGLAAPVNDTLTLTGPRASLHIEAPAGSLNGPATTSNAAFGSHATFTAAMAGSSNLAIGSVGGLPTLQAVNLKIVGTIDTFFAVTGCNVVFHATLTRRPVVPDPIAGAAAFKVCKACHQIGPNAQIAIGPILNGVVGRLAGTSPAYTYSNAMIEAGQAGLVWDEPTLKAFMVNPKVVVPGNKMAFGGLSRQSDVDNITAYLETFGPDGQPR